MQSHEKALKRLHSRFIYERDSRDLWHIMPSKGEAKGDCEDFALTLIKEITGRFWWPLLNGRFKILHCFYDGDGHAILLDRDTGMYADNIQRAWFDKGSACFQHYTKLDRVGFFTVAFRLFRGLRD